MGRRYLSKRRSKVSKRRSKVSKRRNKVTKRINNHKKQLGGDNHKCFYVDNSTDSVPCNAYFYDTDGWYYWKGWVMKMKDRWESTEAELGGFYDVDRDHYVCPRHVEQYKKRWRVRVSDDSVCQHKPDWRKVGKKTRHHLILPRFQSYHNLINSNQTYPEICKNKYHDRPHLKWSEDMGYCCGSIKDSQDDFKNYLIFMLDSLTAAPRKTTPTNIDTVLDMINSVIYRLNREDQGEVRKLVAAAAAAAVAAAAAGVLEATDKAIPDVPTSVIAQPELSRSAPRTTAESNAE